MATVIRNREIVSDPWQRIEAGGGVPEHGDVIVPLAVWQKERDALLARKGRIGVLLEPADEPGAIAADLERLALVAVNFPQFTDGRGYSTARLLRERYGYKGELRAVGDVLRDQLFYLARVGFDAFALRADQDAEAALSAFGDFSEAYQTSVDRPHPLFRRRAA
ncbi:MAG: DUF934 domain-containing protein [Burkholderiales bacterium]